MLFRSPSLVDSYLGSGNILDELYESLSRREKETLTLVLKGLTSREIGDILKVQGATINKHRENIRKKLQRPNFPELILLGKRKGIL